MTLSEKSASEIMNRLGFRDPEKHPKWEEIVDAVQDQIDDHMDSMARIAGRDSIPSMRRILDYEIMSSWWASWVGIGVLQTLAGRWFAWKTKRKYKMFEFALERKKHVSTIVRDNQ